jgi:hypothetical protein
MNRYPIEATTNGLCRRAELRATLKAVAFWAAIGIALAGIAMADDGRFPPAFSSVKDWSLNGGDIVPHGAHPLHYPLVPGHKHALEQPDRPGGRYRKETVVLDATEDFDIPGIGKFKTAVVREEGYLDGALTRRSLIWLGLDKTTKNVYAFGQVDWEIKEGKPVFAGTWRAGDPDGDGVAEPGLAMPGTFTVGARYIGGGSRTTGYDGSENLEAGLDIAVPAGAFKGCARVGHRNLIPQKVPPNEVTDKIWCPGVGLASGTSDGKLVVSNALPADNPASNVSSIGRPGKPAKQKSPAAKISPSEATKIALERMPGKASDVKIERKLGKNVYVVEIQTSGGEKDVFVDLESGKILGTD